jgi:hypothetical protein
LIVKQTLGSRLSQRDREHLVGRRSELSTITELFVDDPLANVILIHGPGGIGKSTLLREVARRGEALGWRPTAIEGREVAPVPESLGAIVSDLGETERPLLLIDSFEFIGAVAGHLRRVLLPSLPERAIVVIAGRRPPDRGWFAGGWERLTLEFELRPLTERESAELLRAHGVSDQRLADELIAWAEGSPLALAMAADAARSTESWSPHRPIERPVMVQTLIRRLTEGELDPAYLDALDVAAIARVTTVELLEEVLDGVDATKAYHWLASRSFTEPLGDGVALHDLVRRATEADLRRRDPERERLLRRRIVDHLYRIAAERNQLLSPDLMHLVRNERIRWGYGWDGRAHYRIDDLAPDDGDRIEAWLAARGRAGLYALSRPFFERAPERVAVARDEDEQLRGYQVSVTPANAPSFAREHPLLGPWLEHADRSGRSESILWSESVDFTDDRPGHVQSMLGMAGIMRSGLANPRYAYMPINPRLPGALAFSEAMGARRLAELDREIAGVPIECHLVDYGEGGLLGTQRDAVYAELGLAPPGEGGARIDEEAVRDALRNLRVPHLLARNELAVGEGIDERAASVRRLLVEAGGRAFGDSADERLLHEVLVRGYLDPAASQEAAADELHLSRSAYFRRLKTASRRVAEYIAAQPDRPDG